MEQRKKILITTGLLVIVGIALLFHFKDSDEKRIHSALDEMIDIVAKQQTENPMQGLLRVRKLEDFLVENPRLEIRNQGRFPSNRQELIASVAALRTRASRIDLSITQRSLALSTDGTRAEMSAYSSATLYYNGSSERYSRQVQFEWVKVDGSWLLRSAVTSD